MLAQKAGHLAADIISGELQSNKEHAVAAFNACGIPGVAFTDPEVAWAGLTEQRSQIWFANAEHISFCWAATPSKIGQGYGWTVSSGYRTSPDWIRTGNSATVRLVRSAWSVSEAACPSQSTADRFTLNGAEVTDKTSGLVWARCAAGQTWNGLACTGEYSRMTYAEAMRYAKTRSGWRVPNAKELLSLVDHGCVAPALDRLAFPMSPAHFAWSKTPDVLLSTSAVTVNLHNGSSQSEDVDLPRNVRLCAQVREEAKLQRIR